jgi:quaternary ammonium compound-resistance protein SugE
MAWVYLLVAGGFEIVWATGLKYTDGFSRLWPSVGTVAAMSVSMVFLALALRAIPIGTAYAIWTGIGAVGVAIMGMMLFNEPRDTMRLFFILVIIVGIVGLKLSSAT